MSVNLKNVLSSEAYEIVKNYALTGQDAISLLGYKNKDDASIATIVSTFSALANPKYLNAIRESYGNEFYNTPYEPRENTATYLNDKYNAFALKGRSFQTTKLKFPLVGDYKVENKRYLTSCERYDEIIKAFESGFNIKIQEKSTANKIITSKQGVVRSFLAKSSGLIKSAGRAFGRKLKPAKYNVIDLNKISLSAGKGIGKAKLKLANGNAQFSGYSPVNLPISQGDKIVSIVDYFSNRAVEKLYKQNKAQTYFDLTPDVKKYMFASQLLANIFICQGIDMGTDLNAKVDHALKLQLSNLIATMSDKEAKLMPVISSNAEKAARVVLNNLGVTPADYVQNRQKQGITYVTTPKNYYELFFGATNNSALLMMDASTEKDAEKIVLYTEDAKIFDDYKLENIQLDADDVKIKPGPMRTFTDILSREEDNDQTIGDEALFEEEHASEDKHFISIEDIERNAGLNAHLEEQPAEKAFEFVDSENEVAEEINSAEFGEEDVQAEDAVTDVQPEQEADTEVIDPIEEIIEEEGQQAIVAPVIEEDDVTDDKQVEEDNTKDDEQQSIIQEEVVEVVDNSDDINDETDEVNESPKDDNSTPAEEDNQYSTPEEKTYLRIIVDEDIEEQTSSENNNVIVENTEITPAISETSNKITTKQSREIKRHQPRKFARKKEITTRKVNPAHILMDKPVEGKSEEEIFLQTFIDTHEIIKPEESERQSRLGEFTSKNHTLSEFGVTERLSDGIITDEHDEENTVILLPSADYPLLPSGDANKQEIVETENAAEIAETSDSIHSVSNANTKVFAYDKSVITKKQAEKAFDAMIKNAVKEVHGFYVKKSLEKPNKDFSKEINTIDFMHTTLDGIKFNHDNPTREMIEGEALLEKLNYIKNKVLDDIFQGQETIEKSEAGVSSASSLINKISKQQHNNSYMKTVLKKMVVNKIAYNKAKQAQTASEQTL